MTYYPSETEITRFRIQCESVLEDILSHYLDSGSYRSYAEQANCANIEAALNYAADKRHSAEKRLFALRSALDNARLGLTD